MPDRISRNTASAAIIVPMKKTMLSQKAGGNIWIRWSCAGLSSQKSFAEHDLVEVLPGAIEAGEADADADSNHGEADNRPDGHVHGHGARRDFPRPQDDDGDVGEGVEEAELLGAIHGLEAVLYVLHMRGLAGVEETDLAAVVLDPDV